MPWLIAFKGKSGFSARNTAEDVTKGIDGHGLTAIITGPTSGIGLETARVLALRGVHVVMAARNLEAATTCKETIIKGCPGATIDITKLDVSSLESVTNFANEYFSKGLPLNILICNAGVMAPPFSLSKDIKSQFATNYLGHFHLTNLLLDTMKNTARIYGREGRVIIVSSVLHRLTYKEGIMFDKLNDEKCYNSFYAYGQSKLANILHAKELARRLKEEGQNITANALHPGVIATNLSRHSNFMSSNHKFFQLFHNNAFFLVYDVNFVLLFLDIVFLYGLFKHFQKDIPQGASTTCYFALNPQVKGVSGEYFADNNLAKPSAKARNADLAKKLWEFGMKLTKSK
ncbi:short-chain dehydrogenase TIC 32, chloroplastic-like [Bidens hawaiensis]|uniref:short-chain dehydrogenase TIC 32, chloroplastic-like n=1 Tax=Bidens hawaiensis TaxID=980011 RepID=UPI00404B6E03